MFGGSAGSEGWQAAMPAIEKAVRAKGGSLAFAVATSGCTMEQAAVLVTPDETVEHRATHGRGIDLGESTPPVTPTDAGNVGLLCGDDGLAPEVGRCLALEGADILAWPNFGDHPMNERIARTRSDENRVYTASAWTGGGTITAPTGAPLTAVPGDTGVAMAAQVNRANARWKDMAPGTHALRDRVPAAYGALVSDR